MQYKEMAQPIKKKITTAGKPKNENHFWKKARARYLRKAK